MSTFEGSVAIGAMTAASPSTLLLALRGSGQGLYVGLADDCYVVASEPYGVVEETAHYVRMDGEHGGEIIAIDAASAGDLDGIRRYAYDGAAVCRRADRRRHRRGHDPRHRPRRRTRTTS